MDFTLVFVVSAAVAMFYISFPQQTLEFFNGIFGVLSTLAQSFIEAIGSLRKGE